MATVDPLGPPVVVAVPMTFEGLVEIGADVVEIPVPGPPIDVKSLALSPDGSIIAVAWIQGSIWWWRTAEPEPCGS